MSILGVMPVYVANEKSYRLTKTAIDSFLESVDFDPYSETTHELFIVDDASPYGGTVGIAHKNKSNLGFAKTVNVGLSRAVEEGKDALLVNADIEFSDNDWLEAMLDTDADIVGAKLLYPSGLVQHAGIYYSFYTRLFSHIGRFAPADTPQLNVERECPVTGALMLIRHHVLEQIGLFDEQFQFGFEDVDYCLQAIKSGLKICYQPKAVALHHESAFRGPKPPDWIKERMDQSWNYFQEKHAGTDIASLVPTLLD